ASSSIGDAASSMCTCPCGSSTMGSQSYLSSFVSSSNASITSNVPPASWSSSSFVSSSNASTTSNVPPAALSSSSFVSSSNASITSNVPASLSSWICYCPCSTATSTSVPASQSATPSPSQSMSLTSGESATIGATVSSQSDNISASVLQSESHSVPLSSGDVSLTTSSLESASPSVSQKISASMTVLDFTPSVNDSLADSPSLSISTSASAVSVSVSGSTSQSEPTSQSATSRLSSSEPASLSPIVSQSDYVSASGSQSQMPALSTSTSVSAITPSASENSSLSSRVSSSISQNISSSKTIMTPVQSTVGLEKNETCKPPLPIPRDPSEKEKEEAVQFSITRKNGFEWDFEKDKSFKEKMASVTTDYCDDNRTRCALKDSGRKRRFPLSELYTADQVHLLPGYPSNSSSSLQVAFYVQQPLGVFIGNFSVLPRNTLAVIIISHTSELETAIGANISDVETLFETATAVPVEPSSDDWKWIVIGVGVGVVVIILILVFVFWRPKKRDDPRVKPAWDDSPHEQEGIAMTSYNRDQAWSMESPSDSKQN
ncbi:hypothetical protein OS493_004581, partial [Desmophyllum pertusum]